MAIARRLSKDFACHVKCLKEGEKKTLNVDLIAVDGDKLANTRSEEWWPRVYVIVQGSFGSDTVYYCSPCICPGFHRGSRGTSSKVSWRLRGNEVGMARRLRTPPFRSRTWYILIWEINGIFWATVEARKVEMSVWGNGWEARR